MGWEEFMPPEEALKITPFVAVYGTLKRSHYNHFLLEGCEFLGEGYTEGKYRLFDVGYPYAVPSEEGFPLKVEVYEVSAPEVMKSLDILEGYPDHYLRKPERVILRNGKILLAWIYYTFEPFGVEVLKTHFDEKLGLEYLEWG